MKGIYHMEDGLSIIGSIERMAFHIRPMLMAHLKFQLGLELMIFGFRVITSPAVTVGTGCQADGIVPAVDKKFLKIVK